MKILENVSYISDNSPEHTLDIYLPKTKSFPVFIYFHGGGLEKGSCKSGVCLGEYLAGQGVATVSADYRKYPTASYPDFLKDGAAVVAWVKNNMSEYGEVTGIFVGGSSAGGYMSMMLCFDKRYLSPYGISPLEISGFVHDAGQPTTHFNVLRERGIDTRRAIIDEAAPIYHIGEAESYPPMHFIVSDNDMPCRLEQTELLLATMKHFGYDMTRVTKTLMHGKHCAYVRAKDDEGDSVLGKMIFEFIEKYR